MRPSKKLLMFKEGKVIPIGKRNTETTRRVGLNLYKEVRELIPGYNTERKWLSYTAFTVKCSRSRTLSSTEPLRQKRQNITTGL